MNKKSFFDNLEERWQKEKKVRIAARKRQAKYKEDLREENKNLSKEMRFKKLYKFSYIVVIYLLARMAFRYFMHKDVFVANDIVFGILTIGLYALYIFKWAKEKK